MKLNVPGYENATIYCLTDPSEWCPAKWRATVFLYQLDPSPGHVPGLGLGFLNFSAGKKIFDGWLKRFGHTDSAEQLRLSIIEGPIPSDPTGYTVFLGTSPSFIPSELLPSPSGSASTKFVRVAQMNRMNPAPGSPHLRAFKNHFARTKRYRLFPAAFDGTQIRDIDMSRYLEKRELRFFSTSALKPSDPEYAAFDSAP